MRYLLDMHVLIWAFKNSPQLKPSIRSILQNEQRPIFVSIISLWEIGIKRKLRKLSIPEDFYERFAVLPLTLLPLKIMHIQMHGSLSYHHRDPFDRMLVAQAKSEEMALITHDKTLAQYDVKIIPA